MAEVTTSFGNHVLPPQFWEASGPMPSPSSVPPTTHKHHLSVFQQSLSKEIPVFATSTEPGSCLSEELQICLPPANKPTRENLPT